MTIRIVVADDQYLVRAGLCALLDSADDLQVVAEAGNGAEAVTLAREHRAELILMDIRMPVMDGLEATRRIVADDTLTGVRILILTTFEVDDYVAQAIRAGASGFLTKDAKPQVLLDAVHTIAAGDALLSPKATRALITRYLSQPVVATDSDGRLDVLTDREREVLAHIAAGLSNDEIAARLVLSPLTVKTHVSRILAKTTARDRAQLVILAYETGLTRPGEQQHKPT
jgi:DNA-binding NarL/FixJ family response regulator